MIKVTRPEQCLKKLNGEMRGNGTGIMVLVIGKLKVKMQFMRTRTPEQ